MATRNHSPTHQHQRGPICKQKAAPVAAGDAKNRKVLGDIGNMVNLGITEGKPELNRPITRSFGATNAHAAAAAKISCEVQDIDAEDAENELSMMEYVEDLYKFYKHQENLCRPRDYMSSQIEINAKMRSILVDWLIEVHHKLELMPETLYLTIFIVDRYLSMETVLRKELQLVGLSSMIMASKYQDIWSPAVHDFSCISDQAYSGEQILRMEKRILNRLNWSLTFPTSYVFLLRFLKAASSDKEMECMTFFFAELALMHYSMVMYCPSMVAASAVYAAHCTLNKTPLWTKTLQYHTGFSEPQLRKCAELMVGFHSSARDGKLTVVYRKYSEEELGGVALRSPATNFVGKLTEELQISQPVSSVSNSSV